MEDQKRVRETIFYRDFSNLDKPGVYICSGYKGMAANSVENIRWAEAANHPQQTKHSKMDQGCGGKAASHQHNEALRGVDWHAQELSHGFTIMRV